MKMENIKYDFVIVGAGALGVFHAYHALKAGKKVLLLEKDKMAQEATVRNFGHVVPSGLVPGSIWHQYGTAATAYYKSIQKECNIGIRNNGSCYIASTDSEVAVLEELQTKFREVDYTSELWTKEQILTAYPNVLASYAKAALFFPQEVSAESEVLIGNVLHYLLEKYSTQLTFLNLTTVVDVTVNANSCNVHTATKQSFEAEHCVVCSGRDFKMLFPEVYKNSGLVVAKLNMMSTFPQPEIQLPGNILTGLTIRRYESFVSTDAYKNLNVDDVPQDCKDYGIHVLFKQRIDGSIIIGDSHQYASIVDQDDLGTFYNDNEINNVLLREAKAILQLKDWNIAKHWSGYYAQHTDEIFNKTINQRVHIVTGIGGKGMTTSAGYAAFNIQKILSL